MARLLVFLALLLLAAGPAGAGTDFGTDSRSGASAWQREDFARIRLIAAQAGTAGLARLDLGVEWDLAPGWKIYWRNPGTTGRAPDFDWQGSDNLARATPRWPAPTRFTLFGIESFGYAGRVIVPFTAELIAPSRPTTLRVAVDYLACSDLCIPAGATLSLTLPATTAAAAPPAQALSQALARVPRRDAGSPWQIDAARFVPATLGSPAQIELTLRNLLPAVPREMIVEGRAGLSFAPPQIRPTTTGAVLRSAVGGLAAGEDLEGGALTVTLIAEDQAAEHRLTLDAPPAPALLTMLALALLGGLVLNLMPCVLPVLSLKLLAVIDHGGARARVRRGFLASAAGIVFSFLVLAAGVIAIKFAGGRVGWGVQFQSPLFLALMVAATALFAINLWGWLPITLPAGIAARLPLPGRADDRLSAHFTTGAFATLLATPCSAPFLGTAVGFALAQGPAQITAIFIALGLGLATPYLLVAALPGLATRLPRPGPWMGTVRRGLGVALAGTALWLLSVLAAQIGPAGALAAGLPLVLAAALLGMRPHLAAPHRRSAGMLVALLFAAGPVAAVALPLTPPAPPRPEESVIAWQPFAPEQIAARVAAGEVVWVDITAQWCLTCLANKSLVLERADIAARLGAATAMQGDWTLPDPAISAYLAGFGRYGIPFDVVYGPGAPAGIVLPEFLTPEAVRAALARAS